MIQSEIYMVKLPEEAWKVLIKVVEYSLMFMI